MEIKNELYCKKNKRDTKELWSCQENLAEILHTNRVRISKIENEKTSLTFNEALIICKNFDISIETFFETTNLSSNDYIKISSRYINNPNITFEEKRDVLKNIHIRLETVCFDELSKINVIKNNKKTRNTSKSNKIDIERINNQG